MRNPDTFLLCDPLKPKRNHINIRRQHLRSSVERCKIASARQSIMIMYVIDQNKNSDSLSDFSPLRVFFWEILLTVRSDGLGASHCDCGWKMPSVLGSCRAQGENFRLLTRRRTGGGRRCEPGVGEKFGSAAMCRVHGRLLPTRGRFQPRMRRRPTHLFPPVVRGVRV